jgi:hypothetical protein
MRIAVILTILARSLDNHIFDSTYAFGEDSGIREGLCQLAVQNSNKESFCRALLLSVFPEMQKDALERRIANVKADVTGYLKGILPSPKEAEFKAGLDRLVRSTYEVWATIRVAQERYEPTFHADAEDGFEWDTLFLGEDFVDSIDQRTAIQGGKDAGILFVFPRLYVIENDQKPRLIADGTVLRQSQTLAAAQEAQEQQMVLQSSPTFGRPVSNGRIQSIWTGMSGSRNADQPQRFLV